MTRSARRIRAGFVVQRWTWVVLGAVAWAGNAGRAEEPTLRAGVAKVDIARKEAGPVEGGLYAKALVLEHAGTRLAIVTVDAVAIGEIGSIGNDFLVDVRAAVDKALGIPPSRLIVNASHCHGIVCRDVTARTIEAVRRAAARLEPVHLGVGCGHEDRIMVNRRLRLKSGREADIRHAYAMPPDDAVAGLGPVDPEIGILRLDRPDGRPLALVYNFACHPIQGVPTGANTADITGFASEVIEDNLGDGVVALFLQGCAGDINPAFYKTVFWPRDAQILGQRLGLSVLKAARKIRCRPDTRLRAIHRVLALPRADDTRRIAALERRRQQLVESLNGTSLNLKTYVQLAALHGLAPKYPSYYAHEYLREKGERRPVLARLDAENRRLMAAYERNVHIMEEITRINTNLRLLRKHHRRAAAQGHAPIPAEIIAARIGDFVLVTFPGELTVQIGLNLKKASPHPHTFVAGYTNGYLYYAPTADQLANRGGAQEDSDCLLAPAWQQLFESRALAMLKSLD